MVNRSSRVTRDTSEDKLEDRASHQQATVGDTDCEYRTAVKQTIEGEVINLVQEQIHAAARELAEEQRRAVREAVEQHKLIIREVLEQEKAALHQKVEEIRRSVMSLGMG
jgi:hypothetical protein